MNTSFDSSTDDPNGMMDLFAARVRVWLSKQTPESIKQALSSYGHAGSAGPTVGEFLDDLARRSDEGSWDPDACYPIMKSPKIPVESEALAKYGKVVSAGPTAGEYLEFLSGYDEDALDESAWAEPPIEIPDRTCATPSNEGVFLSYLASANLVG